MPDYDLISKEYKAAGMYLMELIRAALNGDKAKEKPEHISWENVFKMAKLQSVEAISAYGIETLENLPEEAWLNKWKEKKNQTLFKILHFDMEREQILAEMAARGLSYMTLKGVLIAGYYPKPGMRSMADNDILYGFVAEKADGHGYCIAGKSEEERQENVKKAQRIMVEIMEKRGFHTESLHGNHDTFLKAPFYNFEMHRKFVSVISEQHEYYENSWEKAILNQDDPYGYYLSDEDEYIFFIAHMHKHFSHGGCGVRHLNDIYVFQKKKGASMNKVYLQQELEKLQMAGFEKEIRELAFAVFEENRNLTQKEEELLYYLLGCGVYGRIDVSVANKIGKYEKGNSKSRLMPRLRYIWNRMFPDEMQIKEYFPFFYGKPYLMPILLVYRVIKGVIIHPKQLISEWKNIWKKLKK